MLLDFVLRLFGFNYNLGVVCLFSHMRSFKIISQENKDIKVEVSYPSGRQAQLKSNSD